MSDEQAPIQDDQREILIAQLCGLTHIGRRDGPDATDSDGNLYELKTTTRGGVSTARDVGPHTLKEWRSKYWIIAVGQNMKRVGNSKEFVIQELYIAQPNDLESEFLKIEAVILGRYAPCQRVIDIARSAGANPDDLVIAEYVVSRGVTLNNPHLSLRAIRESATRLDQNDPLVASKVQTFARDHPLT